MNEEYIPLPLFRQIGNQQFVSIMMRVCHINNKYYVVVDERNREVKEYIYNENSRKYIIDWNTVVSPIVVDEIFGRDEQYFATQ